VVPDAQDPEIAMGQSPVTRILIADDHAIMRSGLEFLLSSEPGVEIVGFAGDGAEALSLAHTLRPDILILDLMLPHMTGLVVMEHLRSAAWRPKVLAVSGQASGLVFKQMLDSGAEAIFSKEDDSNELILAIDALRRGRTYLSSTVVQLIGPLAGNTADQVLTPREREVLGLVAEGLSNENISATLGISIKTAKKHRENIRAKLGISTAVEATQAAARLGLIKIG
jgi:DNA-binding NarL/FixJ family response regulator